MPVPSSASADGRVALEPLAPLGAARSRGGSAPASPRRRAESHHNQQRERGRTQKRRHHKPESEITINLKEAKNAADIVREVAVRKLRWRETVSLAEEGNANLFWYERAISIAEVKLLNECQRVNMIPGMHEMARKASLARALNRMRELFPDDFAFFPRSWLLPAQLDGFKKWLAHRHHAGKQPGTYIVKPSAGCQGSGIYLISGSDGLQAHTAAAVQEYLERPLLLDGLKFDFRLYVLVSSLHPLTAHYILCTSKKQVTPIQFR